MVILTAAHCFFDNSGIFVGSPPYDRTLTAFTGRTMLDSGGEPLPLANFYLPPDYDGPAALNDFALVTLPEPIDGPTIKVAGSDERFLWKTGRTAMVAGFGLTAIGGSLSPVLKELEVPVVADSVCSSSNSYGRIFNAESMLCAGYMEGGKDSCFGDSGGPLYTHIDGDGVRLIGIVSTGISCAKPNLPGIYTRISEPEITSKITSMIADIEVLEAFPEASRGLAVVGSGGKPPGCGAASRAAARARAAVRSAGRKVERAKKIVSRNLERLGKAGGERKQAAERLANSRKKLGSAVRLFAKARAISRRVSAAAVAACD
jgi:secreted trypsin-like serine protease